MDENQKEVYYGLYCPICKHIDCPDSEDPCDECLSYPMNMNSHKPVNFDFKEDSKNVGQIVQMDIQV